MMLSSPQPTAYDLKFNVGPVPVRVHPLFWLMGAILGSGGRPEGVLVWILVLFISIMVHEMGHAYMMMRYGSRARVVLYMMGGLAIPEGHTPRDPIKQILISFAGPAAGFVLAAIVIVLARLTGATVMYNPLFGFIPYWMLIPAEGMPWLWGTFLNHMVWINIFWGLINLVPVFPLDGGHIARSLFEMADPRDGQRKALWVSVICGAGLAFVGFVTMGSLFMGVLFGALAYGSWQMLNTRGGGGRWH